MFNINKEAQDIFGWFQNIFPSAKISFAKGKMLGAGRHPTGPEWGEYGVSCGVCQRH